MSMTDSDMSPLPVPVRNNIEFVIASILNAWFANRGFMTKSQSNYLLGGAQPVISPNLYVNC